MADNIELTAAEEEQAIERSMMVWINTYPDLPVSIINFSQMRPDAVSMGFATIPGTRILRHDILGGHTGEYQFQLVYRIKPGVSNDVRLKAVELLNAIGGWASENYPSLGNSIHVNRVEATTRGTMLTPYENGDEDYQILFRMIYEVI